MSAFRFSLDCKFNITFLNFLKISNKKWDCTAIIAKSSRLYIFFVKILISSKKIQKIFQINSFKTQGTATLNYLKTRI